MLYDIYSPDRTGAKERAIAVSRCVHTDVIQLRNWLPANIGAIMWAGLSAVPTTTYVPYYFGISEIPQPFKSATPKYNPQSAFWIFRSLASLVKP